MKAIILALTLTLFSGCSIIESVGQKPSVSIATSLVVHRYISNAGTLEDKKNRAIDFSERAQRVLGFIDGNPHIETLDVMSFVDSSVDWSKLQPQDKFLISEILSLLEAELRKHEIKEPQLTRGAKITLRALLNTGIRAAGVYL